MKKILTALIICIFFTSCNYTNKSNDSIKNEEDILIDNYYDAEEIQKELYNANNISYIIAKTLYEDYKNEDDWKSDWRSAINYRDNIDEVSSISLLSMNNDGKYQALIKEYPAGIGTDSYYILLSLDNMRILLNNALRGEYKFYRINNKTILHTFDQIQGKTTWNFFELTNNLYDTSESINTYYNIHSIDSSIKHIGFCITYGMNAENPHQEKFESGKTVFLYTEDKQQKNEIDDFTKSFEDYTDEIPEHFLKSQDFESFDALVKALKPLDKYMEEDSENQTGNSDAK